MITRFVFALAAALTLAAAVRAEDLPAGTWAVNVDGEKGEFVVAQVKDGKVTGSLLGTDFVGTWDGKALGFKKGNETFEARLVSEPGEKGKTKYTLTGTRIQEVRNFTTRAGTIHVTKTGWYAQLAADTPAPTGFIRAEVRGTLVYGKAGTYVLVKHAVGGEVAEVYVHLRPDDLGAVKPKFTELNGKEVIVTGRLAEISRARTGGAGGLSIVGAFEIKPATEPK